MYEIGNTGLVVSHFNPCPARPANVRFLKFKLSIISWYFAVGVYLMKYLNLGRYNLLLEFALND